jgi:hypothetical protein
VGSSAPAAPGLRPQGISTTRRDSGQGFAARIEAFAEPLPGLRRPAITYQASGQAVSWSELVQLVAMQIRCGHLPNHGGGE